MATDITKINESCKWNELTEGMHIYAGGTSAQFKTGEWRTESPVFIKENCKQCLLCIPVCPDSAIYMEEGKRGEFDFDHCKGCGICANVCPFKAIEMEASR